MKRPTKQDSPYKVDEEPSKEPHVEFNPVPLHRDEVLRIDHHQGQVRITTKGRGPYATEHSMMFDPMHAPAVAGAILAAGDYENRDSKVTIQTERKDLLLTLQLENEQHLGLRHKRDELAKVANCNTYMDAPLYVQKLIDHAIDKGI